MRKPAGVISKIGKRNYRGKPLTPISAHSTHRLVTENDRRFHEYIQAKQGGVSEESTREA
jgi:hypothetical protein